MIIRAFDFLSVGGLGQETAVFYDEVHKRYYTGKSTTPTTPKDYVLGGSKVIIFYGIVRFLDASVTVSGFLPLLICYGLAFIASRKFLARIAKTEYIVEPIEFSKEQELLFLEEQLKKQRPIKCILIILPVVTGLVSIGYLYTNQFLWLFMASLLTWSSFIVIEFFGKTLYKFNKLYKNVRHKYDKKITNW
ncbi:hypothetical protein [Streptococcus ruminantium]|uniref:hypothetical protein n=1 Tax=Streptococcus ruminantium TaxID=1917441 RepID=UPI0012DC272F|nr:hypothetical protein [Streptococcus ruminantium]